MNLCECGCGLEVSKEGNRFILGHHNRNINFSEEHRKKLSESNKGKSKGINNPMYGRKGINAPMYGRKGKNAPRYGKKHSEETKRKMSENSPHLSGKNNSMYGRTGENHPNWQGGISFEPYCYKFNNELKESIRDQYDRKCFNCGKDEIDNITKSNKMIRLSVHHIDMDKEQGCNGKQWKLIPLCMSCHMKLHGETIINDNR